MTEILPTILLLGETFTIIGIPMFIFGAILLFKRYKISEPILKSASIWVGVGRGCLLAFGICYLFGWQL